VTTNAVLDRTAFLLYNTQMNYKFPVITHISQVLKAIEGRKEFIVAEKDGGYTVINYVVAMEDTFPPVTDERTAILRECRGIIFRTSDGAVMARRFHKFFNAGERMETSPQFIDLSKPHDVLEKLDGSMITPLVADGQIRWGTKMGLTDVAGPVEEFVKAHPQYEEFASLCLSEECTPIFEWCSRQQKIVVDYPTDRLVLTALRDNVDGRYARMNVLDSVAAIYDIDVVKTFPSTGDIRSLMGFARKQEDNEGFIVRFDDGHMVKVKSEWYLQLHHAKDVTKFEKNILEIILQDKLDDLLPLVDDEYKELLEEYRTKVLAGLYRKSEEITEVFNGLLKKMKTDQKREFAVHHVKPLEPKEYHSYMFGLWDGKNAWTMLKDDLLKSCSSQNRLDNNRWMMNGVTYNITKGSTDVE
jgi:RNA ligase